MRLQVLPQLTTCTFSPARWASCCITLWLAAVVLGAPERGCAKLLPLGGVGGSYLMLVGVSGLLAQFAPGLLEGTGVLPLARRALVDGFGFWTRYVHC